MTPEERKKYEELDRDFWEMYKQFQDEGLFKPSLTNTVIRISEIAILGVLLPLAYYCVQTSNIPYPVISIGLTYLIVGLGGLFIGRCGFLVHETGHNSLTGKTGVDDFIAKVVMGRNSHFWGQNFNENMWIG